ncbi:DUF6879 family protein [Actinoplanes sp. NPDC026619]|uniref:DUF6879 family protein n=1 Tax=Actinoplanes sp. NPDC026619 TaxID=3155798 RepID=UPI0034103F88
MTQGTNLPRKIAWTALAGFLSFTITGLLDKAFDVSLADQLVVTVLMGGVTLMVQYWADVERRLNESERRHSESADTLHRLIARGFRSVSEATELMSGIEQSAVRHDLLKEVVRRSARVTPGASPLVRFLAGSETERLADTLRALSAGQELFYDGEDREFLLALTRGVTGSLFAASWATTHEDDVGFEAGFWLSDLGARYLDLQRSAVRRGVEIRRIFVVESPALAARPELARVLAMQRGAGIKVRVSTDREAAQDGGLSDYVIFDEQICYDTTQVTRREAPGAPRRLTTRLVLDDDTARHRVERFTELWKNADGAAGPESLGAA